MNIAFIDGQNLYYALKSNERKLDYKQFRIYLKDKYHIETAYYFLGYIKNQESSLYENLQKAGFVLMFKTHNEMMMGKKKGNVDTDIVFEIMRRLIENSRDFEKVLIVSGDGDYKKLIDYLIEKNRFLKILFPNRRSHSSLYKALGAEFYDYLENSLHKFEYKKKGAP